MSLMCLLVLSKLCCNIDIVCGLVVGSVKMFWRMEHNGIVVDVFWPLPSVECALPALATTPLQQT